MVSKVRYLILAMVAAVLVGSAGCAKETTRSGNMEHSPTPRIHQNFTNRLASEKSPYLQQHKHNPVDWYPWGDAAFEKARREGKPIFLSIGYSTCHWCHVMERESFEDEKVGAYLNEHFVSIKVDREERPDVDKIYMTAVQAMTGQGGWPLNIFLTPDLKPFYGGTYYPPDNKFGRPGFLQVLSRIVDLWNSRKEDVMASASDMVQKLNAIIESKPEGDSTFNESILRNAVHVFKEEYDSKHGGFGNAPKFPRPTVAAFLLHAGLKFADKEAVRMVMTTCDKMAAGGIYDQLGGGFARYSVDAEWLVPHFEKMLYDNAQLVDLYLDAYQVSGNQKYADVARDIIRYVLRDMTHPDGGFYSAEDADSEGKEGKFYTWSRAELSSLLTVEEFNVATRYFGISEKGNFVDHSDPEPLKNQNVLSIANANVPAADKPLLESAKRKMFEARSKRVRPHLDDKVLASWNGMMLGAIARAGAVLNDDKYLGVAENNLAFLKSKLWDSSTKTLYHRWREGERDKVQLLDGYANLLGGVIDHYEAKLDPDHLQFAIDLADAMILRFYDKEEGGFWQSGPGATDLILRVKEDYDGAEPSGNSVAILALLKLAAITEKASYKEAAEKSLRLFATKLKQLPQAAPMMVHVLGFLMEEPKRVVITGNPREKRFRDILDVVHAAYQPNKVVLGVDGPVEPFAKELPTKDAPMVFLCAGTSCQPPTRDPIKLREMLTKY